MSGMKLSSILDYWLDGEIIHEAKKDIDITKIHFYKTLAK